MVQPSDDDNENSIEDAGVDIYNISNKSNFHTDAHIKKHLTLTMIAEVNHFITIMEGTCTMLV